MDSQKSAIVTPEYSTQLPGVMRQTDWVLDDLSVDTSRIAVCGNNYTDKTAIELFDLNYSDWSSSIQSPTYSREFPESKKGRARFVAFTDDPSLLVTVYGTQIELYNLTNNVTLSQYAITEGEEAQCITVKGRQLFVCLNESNQVIAFDVNITLKKVGNISLMGIDYRDYPKFITVESNNIFIATVEGKSLKYCMDGNMLHEYPKLNRFPEVHGLTASSELDLVFIAWGDKNVTVYSLSENVTLFSFAVAGTNIIMINSGNRLFKASKKGELDVYSTTTIFTYEHLKIQLSTMWTKNDCKQLGYYFCLPSDQLKSMNSTELHSEMLLLALEERGYVHTSDVNRLTDALIKLGIRRDYLLTETYMKLRGQETDYGRFLASLSTHLTLWTSVKLCTCFKFTDEQMTAALSSRNPGLSVLLTLEDMGVINQYDISQLEAFLQERQLLQAVEKIHEYLSSINEVATQRTSLSDEGKESVFINCLRRKIRDWFETMTPVPWKKSCQWKMNDLFVARVLVLTKSGSKTLSKDGGPKAKLHYRDIFNHERLKDEKRLILVGEPGSGKTMLTSQLAYDWSCGELINIPIVIFLPLKVVGDMTLIQAIQMFYLRKDIPISQNDIETILNSGQGKIYFILDGLEEYNGRVQEGEKSEVMKVLMREKLANCTVLITARSYLAKDLPPYTLLRIGGFGEEERNAYIDRVHSKNIGRSEKVKEEIDNNSFLLEICCVPLLFVLTVHNIDSVGQIKDDQYRVTPFVKAIVGTLCPSNKRYYDHDYIRSQHSKLGTDTGDTESGCTAVGNPLEDEQYEVHQYNLPPRRKRNENVPLQQVATVVESSASQRANISLEELAFNALCRGNQQLVWQKDFVDRYVINSKEWINAGILLVEEGTPSYVPDGNRQPDSIGERVPLETALKSFRVEGHDTTVKEEVANLPVDELHPKEELASTRKQESKSQTPSSHFLAEGSSAKYVSLNVKFLHKLIQEWFAAKFLALLFWGCKATNKHTKSRLFMKHLAYIDPADLHYVLRFTCHICPPSFPIISGFLMQNFRKANSQLPDYIMSCIFYCFSEFDGYKGYKVKDIVAKVCGEEIITISSEDSRLLMRSKISFLNFASNKKIPIKRLKLTGVVEGVTGEFLVMQFGASLGRLDTLQNLEVSRWDHKLKDRDFEDLIELIANSKNLKEARLLFSSPPRVVKDNKILETLEAKNTFVFWMTGANPQQCLDRKSGKWMDIPVQQSGSLEKASKKRYPFAYQDDEEIKFEAQGPRSSERPIFLRRSHRERGYPFGEEDDEEIKFEAQGPRSSERPMIMMGRSHPEIGYPFGEEDDEEIKFEAQGPRSSETPIFLRGSHPERDYPFGEEDDYQVVAQSASSAEHIPGSISIWSERDTEPLVGEEDEEDLLADIVGALGTERNFDEYITSLFDRFMRQIFLGESDREQPVGEQELPDEVFVAQGAEGGGLIARGRQTSLLESDREQPVGEQELADEVWFASEGGGGRIERRKPIYSKLHRADKAQQIGEQDDEGHIASGFRLEELIEIEQRQTSFTANKDDITRQGEERDDFILNFAGVETKIDKEGGVVTIPGTNVKLDIPRGAFEEEISIQMRIIPRHLQNESELSFTSFSSVVVELLPDDTKLLLPAVLSLPHCLVLNENSERTVTVYDSHHAKGSKPVWKVQSDTRYQLQENDCLLWLKSFCWKKYKVGDKLVKGKKITVYAALDQSSTKDLLLLEVGYYLDLLFEKQIIEKNKLAVLKEKPFIFLKEGEMPLTVSFEKNVPVTWHFVNPKENPRVIPFQKVALYEEHTCSFSFTRVGNKDCLCSFSASQGHGNVDLTFVLAMNAVHSPVATTNSHTQEVQCFNSGSSATEYPPKHESVVTPKSLQKLSSKITAEWRDIGRKLKLTEGELSHLREDYHTNQKEVIYQMLVTWKNKEGTAATCRTLRKVLKKCKRADLLKYVK